MPFCDDRMGIFMSEDSVTFKKYKISCFHQTYNDEYTWCIAGQVIAVSMSYNGKVIHSFMMSISMILINDLPLVRSLISASERLKIGWFYCCSSQKDVANHIWPRHGLQNHKKKTTWFQTIKLLHFVFCIHKFMLCSMHTK